MEKISYMERDEWSWLFTWSTDNNVNVKTQNTIK